MPDIILTVPWWVLPAQIAVAFAVGIPTGLLVRWLLGREHRK